MDESYIKIGPNHNASHYNLAITKIPTGKETGYLKIVYYSVYIVVSKVIKFLGNTTDPELTPGNDVVFVTNTLVVSNSYTF